jgi:pimeloyl-ACP methyl ester carboxylesterase
LVTTVSRRNLLPALSALPAAGLLAALPGASAANAAGADERRPKIRVVHYETATVGGVEVFYRDAGPRNGPVFLLLHGFPTSSHMFRNLIPLLADRYRVIAPDYPGFGQSAMPDRKTFAFSFARYAELVDALLDKLGVKRFAIYLMDYGAPVGYRIALKHPERVSALVIQNGNAYDEGLKAFWDPIKAYWADGSQANRDASSLRWRPRNSNTPTGWRTCRGLTPITGCTTRHCLIVRGTRISSSTCSAITGLT